MLSENHRYRGPDGEVTLQADGLQNIAIDPDRARPEFFEIDDCTQRPADQTLNLYAATVEATFCNVARLPRLRRIWEHRILRCKPAASYSLLFHAARHRSFDGDAADHACLPHRDKHRTACMRRDVQLEIERADFIGATAISPLHGLELRCSQDLRDERFYNVGWIPSAKDPVFPE